MSRIEAVVEDLRHLPEAKVEQVAAYVHSLRTVLAGERKRAILDTAGCMTESEVEAFERAIEEGCELKWKRAN